jgi:divinyl protochlorophyllide a 8-vinyl-reductase
MTATADCSPRCAGRIGPNSVIRLIEAMNAEESPQVAQRVFRAAGLGTYLAEAPTEMVDEQDVRTLHHALHGELGPDRARALGRKAGELTADYLMRVRIPALAQALLRLCPAAVASRLLAKAIARNAWTFVGTGHFSATHGQIPRFTIEHCPLCRDQASPEPLCDFYAGTFERLYTRLVDRHALVKEIACQAMGAPACVFAIAWRDKPDFALNRPRPTPVLRLDQ